jgi:signal transduction histidine kinase
VGDPATLLGLRPGEALNCLHACVGEGGCGTSEFCSTCGAVQSILSAQQGQAEERECRILRATDGEAMDLLVRSSPLEYEGESFIVCAITDISHLKRRRALERVFFHDLLNTATGLKMLSHLVDESKPARLIELAKSLRHAVDMLIEEVASQRDLSSAESHELRVRPARISSRKLLEGLLATWEHAESRGCHVVLDPAAEDVEFTSDITILSRVIGNMIKNAVEACHRGNTVTVGCAREGDAMRFWVHNPGFIPREVQLELFKRSFSTKGTGRGLGTYSMRLLTERYLKGKVAFSSSEPSGTTFSATYPMTLA